MRVGVPKEIKDSEFRVGMTPTSVVEVVHHGHEVLVQSDAGLGSGLSDDEYVKVGARIVDGRDEIFALSDMVVKVKEPLAEPRHRRRPLRHHPHQRA